MGWIILGVMLVALLFVWGLVHGGSRGGCSEFTWNDIAINGKLFRLYSDGTMQQKIADTWAQRARHPWANITLHAWDTDFDNIIVEVTPRGEGKQCWAYYTLMDCWIQKAPGYKGFAK